MREVAAYVPGTSPWNSRCRKEIRTEAKRRLTIFRRLRSVPEPLKSQLLPRIRHKETRLAEIEVASGNLVRTVVLALITAVVIYKWAWIVVFWQMMMREGDVMRHRRLLWSIVATLGSATPMMLAAIANIMRVRGTAVLYVPVVLVPLLTWTALFYADSHWHSWQPAAALNHHPYLGAFAIGSALWVVLMALITPFAALQGMYNSRRIRESAGAQLTHLLIKAVNYVERAARHWQESGYKSGIVYNLESVASCLERDMVWDVAQRRQDVVLWFRDALAAKAEGVRQLSRWVLTPKTDTREHLLEQLVMLLAASARDDLDSFPAVSESRAGKRHTAWLRITATSSALLSAIVPGAVVWAAHKAHILMDPWFSYGAIAAILWACVTVMSVLDPSYGDHLESFKKLSDTLRPFGKGKES